MDHLFAEGIPVSTEGLPAVAAGTLPGGRAYMVVRLSAAHAAAVAALHAATIAGLGDGEKAYMLPKDEAYFAAHMARGGGNGVLGVVSEGRLVAQAMIRHPDAAHPDTGMVDMPPVAPVEEISLMQAVSVAPCLRGEGVMDLLVRLWMAQAAENARSHLMAEIHVDNVASWINFLRAGLMLVGMGRDPADGAEVYNAYERADRAACKRLTPEFNRHADCPVAACGFADRTRQAALMAQGYAIVGRTAGKDGLVMRQIPGLSLS